MVDNERRYLDSAGPEQTQSPKQDSPLSKQQLLLLKRRNPAKYRPTDLLKNPISLRTVSLKRSNSDRKVSTVPHGVLTLDTCTTRTRSLMRDSTTDEIISTMTDKSTLRSVIDNAKTYYQERTTDRIVDLKSDADSSGYISEQRRYGSGPSRLISSTIISQGPERTVKDYVIEREVKVPKKVTREEVIEKTVVVLEKRLVEEIVDVPEMRRETVVHVRTPIVTEKIVEVPEYELVEKTVVVPQKIRMQKPPETKKRNIPVAVEVVSELEVVLPIVRSSLKSVSLPVYVPRFVEIPVTAEFCDETLLNTADRLNKDLIEALSAESGKTNLSRLESLATEMNDFTTSLSDRGIIDVGKPAVEDVTKDNFTKWWLSNEIAFRGDFLGKNGENVNTTKGGEWVTLVENPESDNSASSSSSSSSFSAEDDLTVEVQMSEDYGGAASDHTGEDTEEMSVDSMGQEYCGERVIVIGRQAYDESGYEVEDEAEDNSS